MNRIETNEKRLDNLNSVVPSFEKELDIFENSLNDFYLLNDYYGSKGWFDDKNDFESGIIKNVKAGVLSEDAVWNLYEDVSNIIERMKMIVDNYDRRINMEKKCNCSKDCKCGCQEGKECTCKDKNCKDKNCKCGCHKNNK